MATIKSYTDINQSKKLAEILPIESADMCYSNDGTAIKIDANSYTVRYSMWKDCVVEIIPCWSLAALLGVLPKGEYKDVDLCFGGYQGDKYISEWFCSYEQQEPFIIEFCHANNPIDACVAMIEKLHELNLL